jgi:hypothetical protein
LVCVYCSPPRWAASTPFATSSTPAFADHDGLGLFLASTQSGDTLPKPVRFECEQFFLANRFRPVHATSIDVFTKMLEPEPARERSW